MTDEKIGEQFIINAMRESERRIVEDEKFADEVLPDLTPGERRACSAMPDDLVVFLERSGKMTDEKREFCECWYRASLDVPLTILTGHHENCPHAPPLRRAFDPLVRDLVRGIEAWAADEDGVHPECWRSYRHAKTYLGEPMKENEHD